MEKTGKSKGLNALAVFGCVIISIIFVITAFVTPIFYSATGIISPKTITTVVQKINYVEILKNSDSVNDTVDESGVDAELIDEIMKSKEAGRMIHEFSQELTNELMDSNGSLDNVDSVFVQNIVDKHIDDIIPVIQKKTNSSVDADTIKQEISRIIKNNDHKIKEAMLELQPIKETFTTYSSSAKLIQLSSKWYFVLAVCLLEILPLALIYLLRKKNYGGFVWIAVNTGIVGLFVSGVALIVSNGFIKEITAQIQGLVGEIVVLTIGTISTKLTIALTICFAIMIAAIVACVLLRKTKNKSACQPTLSGTGAMEEQTV